MISAEFVNQLTTEDREAWQRLSAYIKQHSPAIVAFSGGVDSALLAAASWLVSGKNMLAVMVDSPVHTDEDRKAARAVAAKAEFPLKLMPYNDLDNEAFCLNPVDRCYVCKYARFKELLRFAREQGFAAVLEGSNLDDEGDYRPGRRAVQELGILSPLSACGIGKAQIRRLSKAMQLPVWDRPSKPCLATRIPYGVVIDLKMLTNVQKAEAILQSLGLEQVRVRSDGRTAKIEVQPEQLDGVLDNRQNIIEALKALGYTYVTLDLEGYRRGSANEGLEL